jgi:hypothetical protein
MQGLSFSGIGGQYYYVMAQLQNKTRIFLDKPQYFLVTGISKNRDFCLYSIIRVMISDSSLLSDFQCNFICARVFGLATTKTYIKIRSC